MACEYCRPISTSASPRMTTAAGPDVGAEVQGIGLQGLAVVLVGDAAQPPRAPEIHHDRDAHHDERPDRRLDLDRVKEQPLARFVNNPDASQQQKSGFEEGGEAFDFAVTILVVGVGRFVGNANREVGDYSGNQIEPRMRRLRQDAQAAGSRADHYLHQRDADGRDDGIQRDGLLLTLHLGDADSLAHTLRLFTILGAICQCVASTSLLISQSLGWSMPFGRAVPISPLLIRL